MDPVAQVVCVDINTLFVYIQELHGRVANVERLQRRVETLENENKALWEKLVKVSASNNDNHGNLKRLREPITTVQQIATLQQELHGRVDKLEMQLQQKLEARLNALEKQLK